MTEGRRVHIESHVLKEAYISNVFFGDEYSDGVKFEIRYRKCEHEPHQSFLESDCFSSRPAIPKTKCPNCQHEFVASLIGSNIVF
jgi:hypothetical protein